jgi:hypothetical protein
MVKYTYSDDIKDKMLIEITKSLLNPNRKLCDSSYNFSSFLRSNPKLLVDAIFNDKQLLSEDLMEIQGFPLDDNSNLSSEK